MKHELYALLIKGDPETAEKSAISHLSCPVTVVYETGRGETVMGALSPSSAELAAWIIEDRDDRPPYRPGSLLFYSLTDCSDIGEA